MSLYRAKKIQDSLRKLTDKWSSLLGLGAVFVQATKLTVALTNASGPELTNTVGPALTKCSCETVQQDILLV